jgi:hypothetical protein
MSDRTLYIVTAVSNPYLWKSRIRLARAFISHMLTIGVSLTVVETAYGERPFELDDITGIRHIKTRASTVAWSKESALNVGLRSLPDDAKYVGWFDSDIEFRRPNLVEAIIDGLQISPVLQPWTEALDMDQRGLAMTVKGKEIQRSFGWVWSEHGDVLGWVRRPIPRPDPIRHPGRPRPPHPPHPYDPPWPDALATTTAELPPYPHVGYAWCARMEFLASTGLLLDVSGLGAGDHQMAHGMVGHVEAAIHTGSTPSYRAHVEAWGERAYCACQGHVGYVVGRIEHSHHGDKDNRKYVARWDVLNRHKFDPLTDIHRNRWGILELSNNKPEFRRDVEKYFRDRDEDSQGGSHFA